jgi:hypothetical protein
MIKYRAKILPPKSKRMSGKVVIEVSDGWGLTSRDCYPISDNFSKDYIEFDLDDDVEYIHTAAWMDGRTYNAYIQYENSSGSRKEVVYLKPERL